MSDAHYDVDLEIRNEFVDEALEDLETVASLFVELESGSAPEDAIDCIFRAAHTIKGNSAYFELLKIKSLAHDIENVLSEVRKGVLTPSAQMMSVLLAGTDELSAMLARVKDGGAELEDEGRYENLRADLNSVTENDASIQAALWEEMIDTLENAVAQGCEGAGEFVEHALTLALRLGERNDSSRQSTAERGAQRPVRSDSSSRESASPPAEAGPKLKPGAGDSGSKAQAAAKTMRVTESSVDSFLSYVGDLVVVREMYEHLQTRLAGGGRSREGIEMRRINESFNDLSQKLQESIMEIRKVSVGHLLQRAPRIIRDVANATGKQVESETEGTSIMVDKSLIEVLEGPLVHMVRNAVDHGIEMPEAREAAGKDPTGRVRLVVSETADAILLEVHDDGRGLDHAALSRKGREMGLIGQDQELNESVILDLLFAPGVSTVAEVSDISGRGVGMDVVRRDIETMGGRIKVTSEPGRGSVFTVEVNKTVNTQIIQGFAFIDHDLPYIVPMERVVRCFRPGEGTIHSAMGKGVFVQYDGQLVPVYNFGLICDRATMRAPGESILLVLETESGKIALQVDDVDRVKQVVVKEVEGLQVRRDLFLGGAVMGDGAVAMIVDVDTLNAEAGDAAPVAV